MTDGKAKAFFILSEADAIEQKVVDVLVKLFDLTNPSAHFNIDALAQRLGNNFSMQNAVANSLIPQVRSMIGQEMIANFRVEHYYEKWNHTAGYRIRYGSTVIQTEQIRIGF